ncbi:MFS transporter [Fictibacillus barbaricus]|uniref:FSR family fosmidomycin resistance protein-like MFS transporter n=1 Tax=Fictibacillus barbaricus TaxID=182136 RepID=A0ABU1TX82_9BACL|nr:MFS transporter [Fictibacillus barbaricus]MDR7071831.1 FSR family fosmidomycin resistance protein-like MFS transporter [Fictibacillus barbaricus]
MAVSTNKPAIPVTPEQKTIYAVLFAISFVHMLNDSMQAVIPAIFPILEKSMGLTFTQLGWIAFTLNITSSIMQPVVGWYTDKTTSPYLLPFGMMASLIGMLGIAFADSFYLIVISVIGIGLGSAVFHPEGSRVAYMAAGNRRGLAQSIYQVGGNSGSSLAPIMTALVFVPLGQFGAVWFTSFAAVAIFVLFFVSGWYSKQLVHFPRVKKQTGEKKAINKKRKNQIIAAMGLLVFLVFARSWYFSGIGNYYQFYLIHDYGLTIRQAQVYIFVFMAAGVLGTFLGGPIADRLGKRNMIFWSMIGTAPLALILPHVGLWAIFPLFFMIGFILNTSFSVTVVYAQELVPGRIGMVSGLIVGLAFGMGALGSVVLGKVADVTSISHTMLLVSFLPLLGLLTVMLPKDKTLAEWSMDHE